MKHPRTKPSLLFRLIVPATFVFILTVLSLVASIFSDPESPQAAWMDKNADALLLWELVIVMVLAILAMAIDRMRTLKGLDEERLPQAPESQPPTGNTAATDTSPPNLRMTRNDGRSPQTD